jgi:purine-binding chemotaxis protein CheW
MSTDAARQLCTFFVDGLFLGIDVTQVQEVLRFQEITEVPMSAPEVSGLINLRGQIVTAIDLRQLLGLAPRSDAPDAEPPMNVVVRDGESALSLLVDQIGDVVDVEASQFERPPETLSASARRLISGVYKLENRLLLLLNDDLGAQAGAPSLGA